MGDEKQDHLCAKDLPKSLYVWREPDETDNPALLMCADNPGECAVMDETIIVGLYERKGWVRVYNQTGVDDVAGV